MGLILDYDRTKYHKTIICDFDDTLSITNTKDWKNSEPNMHLVNKLNRLHNEGWQIIILTARGQLSCDGNVEMAQEKYYNDIKGWLEKHNVKYDIISFNKYLGAYYIDDKGILPEDFCELDIEVLKNGWSGAYVERRGNKVFKTHKDSINAALWYKMAGQLINNIPIVHNIIGDTLCMEYLKPNGKSFRLEEIHDIVQTFKNHKSSHRTFKNYVDRISNHCEVNNDFREIISYLNNISHVMNDNMSFSHGDLSVDNIIHTDNGIYLIDPIYEPSGYSSYLLDYAKLICSYDLKSRNFERDIIQCYMYHNLEYIKDIRLASIVVNVLVLSQFIRIYKYIPDIETKRLVKHKIDTRMDTLNHYYKDFNNYEDK